MNQVREKSEELEQNTRIEDGHEPHEDITWDMRDFGPLGTLLRNQQRYILKKCVNTDKITKCISDVEIKQNDGRSESVCGTCLAF